MSGGSHEYGYLKMDDLYVGGMYDAELDEMMCDLCNLLHDLEWWRSGDLGEEDYRESAREFKDKWFNSDRTERLKPIINYKMNKLRRELFEMIGGDSK